MRHNQKVIRIDFCLVCFDWTVNGVKLRLLLDLLLRQMFLFAIIPEAILLIVHSILLK
jgi:hypothetical protein